MEGTARIKGAATAKLLNLAGWNVILEVFAQG